MKLQFVTGILLLGSMVSCQAQHNFTINGEITGIDKDAKVILYRVEYGGAKHDSIMLVKDSTIARNGKFIIRGTLDEPIRATLQIKMLDGTTDDYRSKQFFFLEEGTTTVKGSDIETAEIIGGPVQADYVALNQQLKPLQEKVKRLSEKLLEKPKEGEVPIVNQMKNVWWETEAEKNKFYAAHPDSWVSLHGFKDYDNRYYLEHTEAGVTFGSPNMLTLPDSALEFEARFNQLSERLKRSKDGMKIARDIAEAKRSEVGHPAMAFTQNTSEGKAFSFATLKGKYVLLDFWSSWCIPCRNENPNLVNAYHQFKDRNFEIVGVSMDTQKDAWLKAIKNDGLPWINVSNLNGLQNPVAVYYNITAIPQNFLISPDGIIIAKNLHGAELAEKLKEILNK